MKLITNAILMLTVLTFAVSGCKKDEGPSNYLQVGDSIIKISGGSVKFYGLYSMENSTYDYDIDLVSPEITLSYDTDNNPVYTGVGTRIYFETYTTEKAAPGDGEYTYLDDGNYSNLTYDWAYYAKDYDWAHGSYTPNDIQEGTLTILKYSGGYTIDFIGKDVSDVPVKLHYKGPLNSYTQEKK